MSIKIELEALFLYLSGDFSIMEEIKLIKNENHYETEQATETINIKEKRIGYKNRKESEVGESRELYQDVMAAVHTDNKIFINHKSKYYYEKVMVAKDKYEEERLSNFIIEPLYTSIGRNGNQKYILRLMSNSQTKVIELDGETLAIHHAFKKQCMNSGKFNWKGKQHHLDNLIDLILASPMKDINLIPYKGWHEKEKIWIFPTHAYYQGKAFLADENGIIEVNNKYFKVDIDKDDEYWVHPNIVNEPSKEDLINYFKGLEVLYGRYVTLCFGYVAGSFHVEAITTQTDFFPFLYIFGKHGQGKSTGISTFTKFAGMKISLSSPPSLDSLRKGVSQNSGIPFVVDEAEEKNDQARAVDFFKTLAEAIKNIYMRQTFIRGDKDEFKKIRYPVKGTLMLGGEVLTSVSSIVQRSVLVDSSKFIQNEEVYAQIKANETIAYWVGQYLMRTSHEWGNTLLDLYGEIMNYFKKQGWTNIHVRIRSNYAIFLAGAFAAFKQLNKYLGEDVFLSDKKDVKEIYQFVLQEMKETQRLTAEDHPSMEFLRKIGLLANKNLLRHDVDYLCIKGTDGNIYLHLAPTNVVEVYKSSEKNPFYGSSNKVVKDLQNQSFFKGFKKVRIGPSQPNSWIIQLSDPNNPELINDGIVHPDLPDTMIYFYK
ncbi:hypothetical protein J2S09_004105 [Bacillus fengqiuensis]|nr:hypothetical protein [Bacillus fengqiuensis]